MTVGHRARSTEQLAGDEGIKDDGGEQRRGVEQDEIGQVVGKVLVARHAERAFDTVRETVRHCCRQHQPRRTVSTPPTRGRTKQRKGAKRSWVNSPNPNPKPLLYASFDFLSLVFTPFRSFRSGSSRIFANYVASRGPSATSELPSQPTWAESAGSCYPPHHHRQLLLLFSPKADAHFTVPRRVEGWVDLGNAVMVCSPCLLKALHHTGCRPLRPACRYVGVNNLPKVAARQSGDRGLNSRPSSRKYSSLTTRLPKHPPHP